MSVGYGTPGLRDYLRTFSDLVDDVDADRRPILEFFPGVETTPLLWTLYSGSIYGYYGQIQYTLDGALRDIVGVDTDLGPLTRVESLAEVTEGTFYSAVGSAESGLPRWDDGVTTWDSAETWDQTDSLDLYVHLPGGVDASAHTIVPLLGFYFGARYEHHPRLGPDKLTNGPFESLTGWTESLSGAGFTSALDSVLFTGRGSANSLKLVSTGAATGNATRRQDLTTTTSEKYRLSGDYRTDGSFSANLAARLLVGNTAGTTILYSDGRDGDSSGGVTLKPTVGEWRRFMFDFVAPDTTTRVQLQLLAASSAGAGQVNFDNVKVQRIYGFHYYEPRLAADSLPEVEVASQSIFFAGKTVGLGQFSLLNADGFLDSIFGQLLLKNRAAHVLVGGSFQDGQSVYRDDYRGGWPGLTQSVDADDLVIRFQTEDARNRGHVTLPLRTHNLTDDPDMILRESGKGRRLVFATEAGVSGTPPEYPVLWAPVRVDLTANGYGVYEVGDVDGSLNNLHDSDPVVMCYPNEELASKDQGGFPLFVGWTWDNDTGLLTITEDVRNYLQNRDGTPVGWTSGVLGRTLYYAWDIGAATITAYVYTTDNHVNAGQLALAIQTVMRAAVGSAADINVTYAPTTGFTISKDAGTLNLRRIGQPSTHEGWKTIGFTDISTDRTGALTYSSEDPTFTDCDTDHVIRVSANGLRDDASGTITGTALAKVVKHCDVARYVLTQYLNIPETEIDSASFVAGRALDSGGVRIILQEQIASIEFLARLERGALADLVVDSDRVWRWRAYQAGATAMADFQDRDFLSFQCSQDPQNLYRAVRVRYGFNPSLDATKNYEYVADSGVATKHGRPQVAEFESWMDGDLDSVAQTQTQRLARLAAADPLMVQFTSRGKLADLLVGDIITITRSRAMTSTGALSSTRFRVLGLRHNYLAGISTCLAVEDVTFLT